jgi:outer membrane lipoprotein SlyB
MKMYQKCLIGLSALLPLLSLGLIPGSANAQQYSNHASALRIDGFSVDEVRNLIPGTDLNFSISGTPGGTATLLIAGAQRGLTLSEVEPGLYDGTYTISGRDSITAQSAVTANLRRGNQVVSAVLRESLQAGAGYRGPRRGNGPNGAAPRIARFEVQPLADLGRGGELVFTLHGTAGGQADVAIEGVKGKLYLQEVNRGEYTGTYSIKRRDRIEPNSAVTATLRSGERTVTVALGRTLLASAPVVRPPRTCSSCGSVEAVNIVEVAGDGGYLGTIGGGVVGALLGNQVGGGSGKTAATIVGAVGGAFAGHAIEGNTRKSVHYEVLVRMQTGATQTVSFQSDPGLRIGDKVKFADGGLVRDM